MEVNIHKLRYPRLVIYNIPETTSSRNTEETLLAQNPELNMKSGNITTKVSYESKRSSRYIEIELNVHIWELPIQKKFKLGWLICNIENYPGANRCFKFSRLN